MENTNLTPQQITHAATNSPELSTAEVQLGGRTFKVVHLPYKEYLLFLSKLQPLMEAVFGHVSSKIGFSVDGPQLSGIAAGSIFKYCLNDLPEMASIVLRQTDPTITAEIVTEQTSSPFELTNIVFAQIEHNKMIDHIMDFFVQIAPYLKLGKLMTSPLPEKETTPSS
jgi:hypothetical protein